jgi:hypothetical protein
MPPQDRQLNTFTLLCKLAGCRAHESCISCKHDFEATIVNLSNVKRAPLEKHNTKLFNVARIRVANFITFCKILVDLILRGLLALTWFRNEG